MLRTLFALVLTAAFGFAQRVAAPPLQLALLDALTPYIGDPAIQKELGLTPEQTEKLLAARKKQWDMIYETAPKDIRSGELSKANEAAFQAVLSREQMARAKQLAAQELWTNFTRGAADRTLDFHRAPCGVLRNYLEFAAALTLDDVQKKAVETMTGGGFAPMGSIYLTAAQADAAKGLLGAPYKGSLVREIDPRTPSFRPNMMPIRLRYTGMADIKKELAITDEQNAALDELRKRFPAGPGGSGFTGSELNGKSFAERAKAEAAQQAEAVAGLEKILTAEQRTRLDQIALQQGANRPEALFVAAIPLAQALGVTEEQRKSYTALQEKYDSATIRLVLSNDPIEKVRAALADLDSEHRTAEEGLLTEEQRKKKDALLGEKFAGSLFGPVGQGFGGGPNRGPNRQRELTFGKYTTELTPLARVKPLQEELKLTEEQIKKATERSRQIPAKFSARDIALGTDEVAKRLIDERSEFVEKALADVLDKKQLARFREVILQRAEAAAAGPAFVALSRMGGAASVPGVAEAIKLTAEQRKILLAGTPSADVLTDDQKTAIKAMLGEKVDIAKFFPTGGDRIPDGVAPSMGPRPRPALGAGHLILLDSQLWDELKLTSGQVDKLAPAANEYSAAMQAARGGNRGLGGLGDDRFGGGFPPPADPEKTKAAADAFAHVADAVLTDAQKTRAAQLEVQQGAARSLVTALMANSSGAADTFNVAPEQIPRLTAIAREMNERVALLNRRGFGSAKATEARRELRDRLDALLMKELTPDQLAKWKAMTGEPYAGFVKWELPGGGFSGGGMGGGNPFEQ